MSYLSLENDELFSPYNFASLLLDKTVEMPDHRWQRDCLQICLCPLVPLLKRRGDPVQTVALCTDFWHVWGKETGNFSSQSKSLWTDTPWASGMCTLQKHWESNWGNDCVGKESFQKLNVRIQSAFTFGTVFCLLSCMDLHFLWD